jgi:thiol-disulfide isomerase/thioredoxin
MAIQFNENVMFLESQDFDDSGNLIPSSDKPVVTMLLASWCVHCKTTKPVFQEFANSENGKNVYTAVIYSDGPTAGEKQLSKRLNKLIPNFRGFPTIVKFKNGKYVGTFEGPRTVDGLKKFAKTN